MVLSFNSHFYNTGVKVYYLLNYILFFTDPFHGVINDCVVTYVASETWYDHYSIVSAQLLSFSGTVLQSTAEDWRWAHWIERCSKHVSKTTKQCWKVNDNKLTCELGILYYYSFLISLLFRCSIIIILYIIVYEVYHLSLKTSST